MTWLRFKPPALGLLVLLSLCIGIGMQHMASARGTNLGSTPERIAAARAAGEISMSQASLFTAFAIAGDARLPRGLQGEARWCATDAHESLQADLRNQSALARATIPELVQAQSVIAASNCHFSGRQANVFTTSHFVIDYNAAQLGSQLSITDYAAVLEQTWQTEISSFGFVTPPVNAGFNIGGRYFVQLQALGVNNWGLAYPGTNVGDNPASPWTELNSTPSCIVLNQTYNWSPTGATAALEATAAHEFFHAVQYGQGAIASYNTSLETDLTFIESATTLIEDEVFDSSNDAADAWPYPNLEQCLMKGIGSGAGRYAPWLTLRAMAEPLGHGQPGGVEQIAQRFFEASSQNPATNFNSALSSAFSNAGLPLAQAHHNGVIALQLMQPCGGGYTVPHCLQEAALYRSEHGLFVAQGSWMAGPTEYMGGVADNHGSHTVSLTLASTATLHITNTDSAGLLNASLVCDTGSGAVVQAFGGPLVGGQGASIHTSGAGCLRLLLVVTNANAPENRPNQCVARSFMLAISDGPPGTATPSPSPTHTPTATPTPTSSPTATATATSTSTPTPNGVELSAFMASRTAPGVRIRWTTVIERDSAGFRVVRADGRWTDAQPPASALLIENFVAALGGATYDQQDTTARASAAYSYWLMEVDDFGGSTWYGPLYVSALPSTFLPAVAR